MNGPTRSGAWRTPCRLDRKRVWFLHCRTLVRGSGNGQRTMVANFIGIHPGVTPAIKRFQLREFAAIPLSVQNTRAKQFVLYDSECPLCTFQMKLLTWL